MAEPIMTVRQNKAENIDALKMKSSLEKMGLEVTGIIMRETDEEKVPPVLIENFLKLKIRR